MEYSIKRFNELTIDELHELLKIRVSVFVVEQNCPYQEVDDMDKQSYHLMCFDNGKLAGYLRIIDKGVSYEEVAIGRVLVAMEYRGSGIASEMMKQAKQFILNTLKENDIRIGAQTYLIKFYESLGFKAVGEEYLEDGIPHIEMVFTN